MKSYKIFFSLFSLFTPTLVFGACSVTNLTHCLDSVCAINIGANPAARCQYCGSESAGTPTKSNAMKTVTAGTSGKYIISDRELRNAPSDPGERYIWASKKCLEKLTECSPDDISDNYDKLIEQSCKAAGISDQISSLSKQINTSKNESTCSTQINACIIDEKRCDSDFGNCISDSDFDKYFADCGVLSTGCESFLSNIKGTINLDRKNIIANAEKIIQNIVASYQNARVQKLNDARASCENDTMLKKCIERVCQNNLQNHCETIIENNKNINEYEHEIAAALCQFYDTACDRLE